MHIVFKELKIEITHSPEFNNVKVMVWLDETLVAEGVYDNFLDSGIYL